MTLTSWFMSLGLLKLKSVPHRRANTLSFGCKQMMKSSFCEGLYVATWSYRRCWYWCWRLWWRCCVPFPCYWFWSVPSCHLSWRRPWQFATYLDSYTNVHFLIHTAHAHTHLSLSMPEYMSYEHTYKDIEQLCYIPFNHFLMSEISVGS